MGGGYEGGGMIYVKSMTKVTIDRQLAEVAETSNRWRLFMDGEAI